jgi:hypothetical protein
MIFVFDENYPIEFVHGLAILEKANKRTPIKVEILFSPEVEGCGYNADDDVIVKEFSKKEAVIITHDQDFRRVKHLKPLLIEHQVGYIIFRVPKGIYHYWDIVKAFINKWEELKQKISTANHPFAFEVTKQGHVIDLSF